MTTTYENLDVDRDIDSMDPYTYLHLVPLEKIERDARLPITWISNVPWSIWVKWVPGR